MPPRPGETRLPRSTWRPARCCAAWARGKTETGWRSRRKALAALEARLGPDAAGLGERDRTDLVEDEVDRNRIAHRDVGKGGAVAGPVDDRRTGNSRRGEAVFLGVDPG